METEIKEPDDALQNEEVEEAEAETGMEEEADADGDNDNDADDGLKKEVFQVDTTAEYEEVFAGKTEFDSWVEFTTILEEFQTKSGTYFKPRSACSVDYANERRVNSPIDDRFVYSNVKMICVNFGESRKSGAGQKRNYVGKGCGAFLNVSYNKGALRITQSCLIHNHPAGDVDPSQQRHLRVVNFNEEVDLIICREVMKVNPFVFTNGEKQWTQAVEALHKEDDRLASLTPRLVKKRIRFLVDKFMAITHGRRPPPEDEMGCILYELDRTRKDAKDNPMKAPGQKRRRGRPRKRPLSEEEDFLEEEIAEASPPPKRKYAPPASPSTSNSQTGSQILTLLTYLQKKDEEDRRMRQSEIDLRKEELSFQRQRFDFEKIERKAHLDLLRAQVTAFERSVTSRQQQVPTLSHKNGDQVEYTIVVDGNNQVINSMPTLS